MTSFRFEYIFPAAEARDDKNFEILHLLDER